MRLRRVWIALVLVACSDPPQPAADLTPEPTPPTPGPQAHEPSPIEAPTPVEAPVEPPPAGQIRVLSVDEEWEMPEAAGELSDETLAELDDLRAYIEADFAVDDNHYANCRTAWGVRTMASFSCGFDTSYDRGGIEHSGVSKLFAVESGRPREIALSDVIVVDAGLAEILGRACRASDESERERLDYEIEECIRLARDTLRFDDSVLVFDSGYDGEDAELEVFYSDLGPRILADGPLGRVMGSAHVRVETIPAPEAVEPPSPTSPTGQPAPRAGFRISGGVGPTSNAQRYLSLSAADREGVAIDDLGLVLIGTDRARADRLAAPWHETVTQVETRGVPPARFITTDELNVRDGPDGTVLATVPPGTLTIEWAGRDSVERWQGVLATPVTTGFVGARLLRPAPACEPDPQAFLSSLPADVREAAARDLLVAMPRIRQGGRSVDGALFATRLHEPDRTEVALYLRNADCTLGTVVARGRAPGLWRWIALPSTTPRGGTSVIGVVSQGERAMQVSLLGAGDGSWTSEPIPIASSAELAERVRFGATEGGYALVALQGGPRVGFAADAFTVLPP